MQKKKKKEKKKDPRIFSSYEIHVHTYSQIYILGTKHTKRTPLSMLRTAASYRSLSITTHAIFRHCTRANFTVHEEMK